MSYGKSASIALSSFLTQHARLAEAVRPVRPWPDHFLASRASWKIKTTMDWFVNVCSASANLCTSRCHVCSDGIFCQLAIDPGSVAFIWKLLHSVLQPKVLKNVEKSAEMTEQLMNEPTFWLLAWPLLFCFHRPWHAHRVRVTQQNYNQNTNMLADW